jgi:hypothetical protein
MPDGTEKGVSLVQVKPHVSQGYMTLPGRACYDVKPVKSGHPWKKLKVLSFTGVIISGCEFLLNAVVWNR